MSSITANPELHAFQVSVRDAAQRVAEGSYGAKPYVDQFLASLGLDNLVEHHEVVVRVTVPAASAEEATQAVNDQVATVYLPTGWAVSV